MWQRVFLLLTLSWYSFHSYATDVVLYAPEALHVNPIVNQLVSTFGIDNTVDSPADMRDSRVVVGTGPDFLDAMPRDQDMMCLAVLPYATSRPAQNKIYHHYYHVAPDVIAAYLSERFSKIKVGFVYYDKTDPFYVFSQNNPFDNVQFIGRQAEDDLFEDVRRLQQNKDIDIFLISNDTRIYTGRNLRFLLEDLYRKNIPVLALNQGLINAGATFTLTPILEDFVANTAALSQQLASSMPGSRIPQANYALSYRVSVNDTLARRYRLKLVEREVHHYED
ncbi:hypothetical protein [Alteromonas macleodii]|uniref:ABC transporter substrate-binding protein n=1 Tax=Alteromonas macleodii TaxID=28108 RepID=A0AB36FNG7_ALTMA|nr:hypothetical protein [Alteromonas macleodii]OES24626.1 hypothetical protein BFV93_4715 [Alteromonas macleodii]OES25378.1 hypothetical protein BFV94_4426 [Alteromonas macleodii]OES25387.1 hypothetical protein BFV95_4416 [Alteromonas macleodii]OES38692.1 hypothetical protein BFV96_4803 [Alteromonas macleodii]